MVNGDGVSLVKEDVKVRVNQGISSEVGQQIVEKRVGVGRILEAFKRLALVAIVPAAGPYTDPDYSPSDPTFDIPFVDDPDIPGPR